MMKSSDREISRLIINSDLSNRRISMLSGVSHTSIANYRKKLEQHDLDWLEYNGHPQKY